ncbi:MAG: LD-carboxypeptidase [Alphaproteobacteria bacterium]|nr:LD-carboxypeptidase [Alphaproteobacteria bacterium]
MPQSRTRIGIVAPASRIAPELAERVAALAERLYPGRATLTFHPQCFLSSGHFAGGDEARAEAFRDFADDASFDAVWFARGGYGSGRIAGQVTAELSPAAKRKTYLGYSDMGYLLGGLYAQGCRVAHGPMPADLKREGGEAAVARGLRWLVERSPDTLEPHLDPPCAAFNITVLSHMLGTEVEPDLTGHVLMLEDVSEHMYRLDRAVFHILAHKHMRGLKGIRLGRVSDVQPNDPDFGEGEEEIVRRWCARFAIPYLGRADIGHDVDNKVVPFGRP